MIIPVLSLCGCRNSDTKQIKTITDVTSDFQFSILKIGKADAIIMKTGNHSVIIDCGEEGDGDEIIKYLAYNGIKYIDYLLISHFDKDHVGGAAQIIENIEIGQIITPDYEGTNDEFKNYQNAVTEKNISPLKLTENMSFTLDNVLFEVYPPLKTSYDESDNDFSLAVGVTHGENTFMFAGDAEAERIKEIITQTNQKYDFLKVPHHGKYNKKIKKFVSAIKPDYAVITCSDKNSADKKTIEALEAADSMIYYTKDGDVSVTSTGNEIYISQ